MPTITRQQARRLGKPTHGLQTILLPKLRFTKETARTWLRAHGYKYGNHRQTTNYHRFMQTNPVEGAHYRTEVLPNGVELVYMF